MFAGDELLMQSGGNNLKFLCECSIGCNLSFCEEEKKCERNVNR